MRIKVRQSLAAVGASALLLAGSLPVAATPDFVQPEQQAHGRPRLQDRVALARVEDDPVRNVRPSAH
jgi:hypothetical protein